MRLLAWSLTVTAMAAALFIVGGNGGFSDEGLRGLGAAGGAALALFAAAFGTARSRRDQSAPLASHDFESHAGEFIPTHRFLLERRAAPRHDIRLPVQFAIDGQSYSATLVSVSARGALLRLAGEPGTKLHARVGQPVRIADYPSGTLARIGNSGIYIDFAVQFEPASQPESSEPSLVGSAPGRLRRV